MERTREIRKYADALMRGTAVREAVAFPMRLGRAAEEGDTMTDAPGPTEDSLANTEGAAAPDVTEKRFDDIMGAPRTAALVSGTLTVVPIVTMFFVQGAGSGLLLAAGVGGALVFVIAVLQIFDFSPAAVARLERLAQQVDGRFALWKPGSGGYQGVPFKYSVERQRFGVLDMVAHGSAIEIGHLVAQASHRQSTSMGRRHAYLVFRLPERLPNMVLSFGHLSTFLGVRVMPEQWHRSQRIDVGGGRRFRLFVGDGGEDVARSFFTPDAVQLFQRVGRFYDVEIKGRDLYLFSTRSPAAGSERRWAKQRALVESTAAALSASGAWDLVRRQSRGRGPSWSDLRLDIPRAVTIVISVMVAAIVVLSFFALKAAGLLY